MLHGRVLTARRRVREGGFTLIELLVVVSIIALLVGLLLPALGHARKVAQTGFCVHQQGQCAQAMAMYATEQNDWLAGPNTSGLKIGVNIVENDPDSPTQNMDWVSPTMGHSLGFEQGRRLDVSMMQKRAVSTFEEALACPSNRETYDYRYSGSDEYGGKDVTDIRIASYAAALGHHLTSRKKDINPFRLVRFRGAGVNGAAVNDAYRPQLTMVRNASQKIYTMDGVRFMRRGDYAMSFNGFEFQDEGGDYMTQGPVSFGHHGDPHTAGAGPNLDAAQQAAIRRYAYRHNDGAMVASFFDGRAEVLSIEESRKADYYYPSGSIAQRAGWGHSVGYVFN